MQNPRLIFKVGESGKLTVSFTGSSEHITGIRQLKLDTGLTKSHAKDDMIAQIQGHVKTSTGLVGVEFPGESIVRNVPVDRIPTYDKVA
jgi:hypothetical protein